jgi:hypothetical protein
MILVAARLGNGLTGTVEDHLQDLTHPQTTGQTIGTKIAMRKVSDMEEGLDLITREMVQVIGIVHLITAHLPDAMATTVHLFPITLCCVFS